MISVTTMIQFSLMFSESTGAVCAVESMRHPWKQFRCDFWVHRGCFYSRIHASLVGAVSLIISELATTKFSLMFSESIGAVCAVESTRHPWLQFRWWFLSQKGLFALSNPYVTRGSSFVDDFWGHLGFLCCRIHASSVAAVSLRISQTTATLFLMLFLSP